MRWHNALLIIKDLAKFLRMRWVTSLISCDSSPTLCREEKKEIGGHVHLRFIVFNCGGQDTTHRTQSQQTKPRIWDNALFFSACADLPRLLHLYAFLASNSWSCFDKVRWFQRIATLADEIDFFFCLEATSFYYAPLNYVLTLTNVRSCIHPAKNSNNYMFLWFTPSFRMSLQTCVGVRTLRRKKQQRIVRRRIHREGVYVDTHKRCSSLDPYRENNQMIGTRNWTWH